MPSLLPENCPELALGVFEGLVGRRRPFVFGDDFLVAPYFEHLALKFLLKKIALKLNVLLTLNTLLLIILLVPCALPFAFSDLS